jgi:ribosomal protein S18 acetylase RimI-like enzyme
MPVTIRNLKQEDFQTLWEMDWQPLIKERDSIYLIIAVDQQQTSFVAHDDATGQLLGVLLASRSCDGKSCFINHLLVKAEARGQGIGSALVERLVEAGREMGIKRIWFFTSENNRKFYEKLGFKEDYTLLEKPVEDYVRGVKRSLVMWRGL